VMSAAALGSILSSSYLGKLADRIGHWTVITACLAVSALLLIPQDFVDSGWQLILLRFLMGLALGGLLPCIAAVIRHNVPEIIAGGILGYSVSAQYAGQVIGPLAGVTSADTSACALFSSAPALSWPLEPSAISSRQSSANRLAGRSSTDQLRKRRDRDARHSIHSTRSREAGCGRKRSLSVRDIRARSW